MARGEGPGWVWVRTPHPAQGIRRKSGSERIGVGQTGPGGGGGGGGGRNPGGAQGGNGGPGEKPGWTGSGSALARCPPRARGGCRWMVPRLHRARARRKGPMSGRGQDVGACGERGRPRASPSRAAWLTITGRQLARAGARPLLFRSSGGAFPAPERAPRPPRSRFLRGLRPPRHERALGAKSLAKRASATKLPYTPAYDCRHRAGSGP